jgi:hypothetical protein
MTPVAAALGATAVTVALGGTLATANQYAGGWLQVDTTPGNGRMYAISGHPAAALSTNLVVTLAPDDPIRGVALTTASRVGLIANPYNGVIETPLTTATGVIVGVALEAVPINNFCWLQTWGPAPVLINGTPALGSQVIGVSATTAGTVDIAAAATLITGQQIGRMMQIGVSGKNNAVFLTID